MSFGDGLPETNSTSQVSAVRPPCPQLQHGDKNWAQRLCFVAIKGARCSCEGWRDPPAPGATAGGRAATAGTHLAAAAPTDHTVPRVRSAGGPGIPAFPSMGPWELLCLFLALIPLVQWTWGMHGYMYACACVCMCMCVHVCTHPPLKPPALGSASLGGRPLVSPVTT